MSQNLTIDSMATELQRRLPVGLTSAQLFSRLNDAYFWVSQRGPMVWLLRTTTIMPETGGVFSINFKNAGCVSPVIAAYTPASDFDPGRDAYLSGPSEYPIQIPYKPYSAALRHQRQTGPASLTYSIWTYTSRIGTSSDTIGSSVATGKILYTGYLFPAAAYVAGKQLPFTYHAVPAAVTTGGYFPSPDNFDLLIIDLAEAECRRTLGLSGWEIVRQRAQEEVMSLVDGYHSTKVTLAGLADEARQAQESQAKKAH